MGVKSTVQRYPVTTLAAIVAVVGLVVAAGLLLSTDDAGTARLALLVAIATNVLGALLATRSGETSLRKTEEVGEVINVAVRDGEAQAPAALDALRLLVEATQRAERAAVKVESVANGHTAGDVQTRATDA